MKFMMLSVVLFVSGCATTSPGTTRIPAAQTPPKIYSADLDKSITEIEFNINKSIEKLNSLLIK